MKSFEPGHRWGSLTLVREAPRHTEPPGKSVRMMLCQCDCGKRKQISLQSLQKGRTKTCGCGSEERRIKKTHGKSDHPLYEIWSSMRARCNNEKHSQYHNYGGRGIKVSPSWDSFETFLEDMEPRPEGFQLDREDNDGDYGPHNCRWVSPEDNSRNRRGCYDWYVLGDKFDTGIQASKACGLSLNTLTRRCEDPNETEYCRVLRDKPYKSIGKVKQPRFHSNPEASIQKNLIEFLVEMGWVVKATHGSAYSSGFPDLFCWHPCYGLRWVDVKVEDRFSYTKAQCQTWTEWESKGLGVWIMFGESCYDKLFGPPNFRDYWKPRYDQYLRDVDDILSELDDE